MNSKARYLGESSPDYRARYLSLAETQNIHQSRRQVSPLLVFIEHTTGKLEEPFPLQILGNMTSESKHPVKLLHKPNDYKAQATVDAAVLPARHQEGGRSESFLMCTERMAAIS